MPDLSTDDRAIFESYISAPPFERDIARYPLNETKYSWPGSYVDFSVELAWEMWKEAKRGSKEILRDVAITVKSSISGRIATMGKCLVCRQIWPYGEPEEHLPDCRAKP